MSGRPSYLQVREHDPISHFSSQTLKHPAKHFSGCLNYQRSSVMEANKSKGLCVATHCQEEKRTQLQIKSKGIEGLRAHCSPFRNERKVHFSFIFPRCKAPVVVGLCICTLLLLRICSRKNKHTNEKQGQWSTTAIPKPSFPLGEMPHQR